MEFAFQWSFWDGNAFKRFDPSPQQKSAHRRRIDPQANREVLPRQYQFLPRRHQYVESTPLVTAESKGHVRGLILRETTAIQPHRSSPAKFLSQLAPAALGGMPTRGLEAAGDILRRISLPPPSM